jgi:hypothetical protein
MMLQLTVILTVLLIALWMAVPQGKQMSADSAFGFHRDDCENRTVTSQLRLASCFRREPLTIAVNWEDAAGESSYRVSGLVHYMLDRCEQDRTPAARAGPIEFDDVLPANTTWFALPAPSDHRQYFIKEYDVRVEAISNTGRVLREDGQGLIGELPGLAALARLPPCPKDEDA